jgi:hypothetical protein
MREREIERVRECAAERVHERCHGMEVVISLALSHLRRTYSIKDCLLHEGTAEVEGGGDLSKRGWRRAGPGGSRNSPGPWPPTPTASGRVGRVLREGGMCVRGESIFQAVLHHDRPH